MPKLARQGLDRDKVLRAALGMLDAGGPAALTMRSLGRALGVEAMSLYHHVDSREDLLDGVAGLLVQLELPVPAQDQPWDQALRQFVVGIRRTAQRHPAAFELVGLLPLRDPKAFAAVAGLLGRLHDAGAEPDVAVAAYRLGAAYARGFALAEIAGLTLADASALPESGSPDRPAALRTFAPALAGDSSAVFEAGLDLVIRGVAARLRSSDRSAG